MLPHGGEMKMTREQISALPVLDEPKTVRIKFIKVGKLQYISHLDLQRTMSRVITRTGIPVWFTQGFNPHAKLVFAAPIAVGVQSRCEYLDIKLDRDMSCTDLKDTLNAGLTDELCVLETYEPSRKFSDIVASDYVITVKTAGASADMAARVGALLSSGSLNMNKRSKSGDREVDIIPMIKGLEVSYCADNGTLRMDIRLPAGGSESLNPELVMMALRQNTEILSGDAASEWYSIMRIRLIAADGSEFV